MCWALHRRSCAHKKGRQRSKPLLRVVKAVELQESIKAMDEEELVQAFSDFVGNHARGMDSAYDGTGRDLEP